MEKDPNGSQRQGKAPTAEKPDLEIKLREVPAFHAAIPRQPSPWPFPATGLSFQMSQPRLENRFKPIGDACYGPDRAIYMTFPTLNLVVVFTLPHYEPVYWGAAAYGGGGEPIKDPETIQFVDGDMVLTNRSNGLALVYDRNGRLQNAFETHFPAPLAGAESQFIVNPQEPGQFWRVDGRNQVQQVYRLHGGMEPGSELIFEIGAHWQVMAAARRGNLVHHFQRDGRLLRLIHLKSQAPESPGRLLDMKWSLGHYWLLFSSQTSPTPHPHLLVLTERAEVVARWTAPFNASGLDVHASQLLLFDRENAAAQTYRLEMGWQKKTVDKK